MQHAPVLRGLLALMPLCFSPFAAQAQIPDSLLRAHIVHEFDELGLDIYRDDRIPSIPDTSVCFLYVGRKQNGPLWIRLQVRHASYTPLHITKIKFTQGDTSLEISPMPELLHHGDNGMIRWEWYDAPPDDAMTQTLLEVIARPGMIITITGRDHVVERPISEVEREAMDNVVQQARLLGRAR